MKQQLDMFDICARKHRGNPQSKSANAKIHKDKRSIREKIADQIAHTPNITCEELELTLGLKHQTCSARLSELKRDDRVVITGERETTSGCMAATYGVSDER